MPARYSLVILETSPISVVYDTRIVFPSSNACTRYGPICVNIGCKVLEGSSCVTASICLCRWISRPTSLLSLSLHVPLSCEHTEKPLLMCCNIVADRRAVTQRDGVMVLTPTTRSAYSADCAAHTQISLLLPPTGMVIHHRRRAPHSWRQLNFFENLQSVAPLRGLRNVSISRIVGPQ